MAMTTVGEHLSEAFSEINMKFKESSGGFE